MFHSSSSILEAQAMAYLAEDTSSSEGGPDPLIHIETEALTQETDSGRTQGENIVPSSYSNGSDDRSDHGSSKERLGV